MATLSTHTLNSIDGSHAGNIDLTLTQLKPDGSRTMLINAATDPGGRFKENIPLSTEDTASQFEMALQTGEYFAAQNVSQGKQILREVVIRFEMPETDGVYHIPLMLAPHSYSVWWSGE